MSQRVKFIEEDMIVNLTVKVTLKSFSNHDGFRDGQIGRALKEFKEKILKELEYKINGEYSQDNLLDSVDIVNYEVDSESGL